jgi:hypothetical protein
MPAPLLRRVLLLTGLAALFVFLADLSTGAPVRAGGWAKAPSEALRSMPDGLVPVLAAVAGIAAATIASGPNVKRQAAWIAIVMTTMMLVTIGASRLTASAAPSKAPQAVQISQHDPSARAVLATADQHQLLAMRRTEQIGLLLLPTVLVGIVLGLRSWVNANVIFRTSRSAVTAMRVIGWLASPALCAAIMTWSNGFGYDILFRGNAAATLLIPYGPAAILATLGWMAAPHSPQTLAAALSATQPRDA